VAYLTALDIKKINGYSFLPIQGSDYNLKVKYFNNNSWAVSSITPIKGFSDSLTAVYEKNGDNYKTVIYPSNLILQKNINNLPSVVQSYLKSLHAVKLGNS
jgi:hypothetical protein